MNENLTVGKMLYKEAFRIADLVKEDVNYKMGIKVSVEDYMKESELFNKLLTVNKRVWEIVANFIELKVNYHNNYRFILFDKFTNWEAIKNYDEEYYIHCKVKSMPYDRF